ncbi:MAG: CarD family transcriptional regulator [Chloroflexota bacterium]|nr:CarD family transcriptional regulator [Chloroflexota bacterium]
MYEPGTKVVHPFYGAGIVTDIQAEDIEHEKYRYYVIETAPNPNSTEVIVPVEGAVDAGLRPVNDLEDIENMLSDGCVVPNPDDIEDDFHIRQDAMNKSLKSGSFKKVVETVTKLAFMSSERSLSIPDRQILDKGKDLLACELALASDSSVDAAKEKVEQYLKTMLSEA